MRALSRDLGDPRLTAAFPSAVRAERRSSLTSAWVVLLAATPFLAAAYLLLPVSGPARTIAYPAFGVLSTIAILLGVHRLQPTRPRSWRLIALALALLAIGDIVYSLLLTADPDVPYPSYADIAYFAGYFILIAGIAGLVRRRTTGGEHTQIIDAAILASGAAAVFWVALVQPSLVGTVDPLVATFSMAYPVIDLVLLTLCLRVVLSASSAPRYLRFLIVGMGIYFLADVVYALAILDGTYVDGHPVDAGWIVGILLVGVAALHPSVAEPVATVEPAETRLSWPRFALLAIAAMVAPTILVIREVGTGDDVVVGLVIAWTALFGLVLGRLAITVHELAGSLQQRRHLQGDLAHQANHDPLTQLANRLLFEARLTAAMASEPDRTAVVFLDLDDFKTINDTLGHATGDDLLRILAGRVQRALRSTDLAARIGGDEFAILVEECPGIAVAMAVAERAIAVLRAPVELDRRQLSVRGSAGVAIGHRGSTPTDLMRDADVAMYQAKAHGKDQVETYNAAMHGLVVQGYELRTELAEAIESRAFVLHYQPAIDLNSGAIVGAEALVRWNHPDRGLLAPAEFIPQAESSGLIVRLGHWILREACATAATWPALPDGRRPAISVNLAAAQVHHVGLVEEIAEILRETGLSPDRLVLEVTESALVDMDVARATMSGLHDLGTLIALDDFGTGYSALSYLAELPFDIVKIDQSFVASMGNGDRSDALLKGIIGLCDALELITVAEGIEEGSQLERLVGLGCQVGQGYLFSRPVPAALLVDLFVGWDQSAGRLAPGGASVTPGIRRGIAAAD